MNMPTTNPASEPTTNPDVGQNPVGEGSNSNGSQDDDHLREIERKLEEAYKRIERGATLIEKSLRE